MALKGVTLTQTFVFESDSDPDKGTDQAARFTFKALDAFQSAFLNDKMMTFEGIGSKDMDQDAKVNMGRVALEAVRMSLVDTENFIDPATNTGMDLKKENARIYGRTYSVVSYDQMMVFPASLLQEMYNFIAEQNGLSRSEAKKSASP